MNPLNILHLVRFHTSFFLHIKAHKNSWYKEWHQWRFSHHFHVLMLVFYIASILLGSLAALLPGNSFAASKDWAFNEGTPSDYYSYNGTKITVGGGTASLWNHTPGADWIADAGGAHFYYRKALTISNSGGALSNYQIPVTINLSSDSTKLENDCKDLRFTKSDGMTALDYWVESCSATSVKAWVEVDTIAASPATTTVYMYYGNPSATDAKNAVNTFVPNGVISDVKGAWDLNENGGSGIAITDLADGNNGTTTNTSNAPDRYGNNTDTSRARAFDGSGDYIGIPHTAGKLEFGANDTSFVFWVKMQGNLDQNQYFLNKYAGGNAVGIHISYVENDSLSADPPTKKGSLWAMEHDGADTDMFYLYSNATNNLNETTNWHQVTYVRDNTAGNITVSLYLDGVLLNTYTENPAYNITYNDKLIFGGAYTSPTLAWLNASMDDVRIFENKALTLDEVTALYGGGGSTSNKTFAATESGTKKLLVHKYSASVGNPPAITDIDSSSGYDGYYYNDYPTIQNEETGNGVPLSYIQSMIINTTGTVRFQITPDNGATWYRWNGSAWAAVTDPDTYAENKTNIPGDVTTNISSFHPGGANPGRIFRWRAFLVSDGYQTATIDDISITTYFLDTAAPDNPVIGGVTAYESDGGPTWTYDAGQLWHKYSAPKFVWAPPNDNNNGGEEDNSGIWRYYAKLTTDSGYTPTSADATPNNYLTASSLTNGQTYYLRVKTIDNAENESATATLLIYKYDNVNPIQPGNLQVNTLQPTDVPLSFNWGVSTDDGTPGAMSELDHYEYKKGSISDWTSTTATSVSDITGDEDGDNVFRVVSVDKAGNRSTENEVTYKYILDAPSEPLNVTVDDQEKTENNFTFTWSVPSYVKPGNSIAGYRYSVNNLPNANNTTDIGNVLTTGEISAATQQGTNRLYVVAYDNDSPSRINYAKYGWVDFNVDTTATAPTAPRNVAISDVSDRNTPEHFAIALSWKSPLNYSAGTFGRYNIRRTTSLTGLDSDADWLALTPVGTATSNAFAESLAVGNVVYYYRVSGVDNAGAEVNLSEIVQKIPTGKYIEAPGVPNGPSVTATATTAIVSWVTDRPCYSKVEYGKAPNSEMQNSSLQGVTAHSITLYGLDPGTTYHYRVQSLDSGDQKDYDNIDAYTPLNGYLTFQTQPAPGISDVKISDIRLDSALVTWKTTSSATSTIKYGKTNSYGKEIVDSSGSSVTTHTVKLSGLDHSSTYHFKIFGSDTDGNVMQSDDYNFDTLTFPKITGVNFQQIKGTATSTLKATWESNVPISSVVQYTDPTGKTMEAAQSEFVSKHEMVVSGLKDNTEYTMNVRGRDAYGNEGLSETEKVKTDFDTRPPEISEITTETSISGYGSSAKSQLIVSWYTDEPSTSQVEYAKGVSGDTYTSATKEDSMLTTSHVVVVSDLDPSSSYYFRVVSKDTSKNEAKSDAQSALTEQARSSIFDIVLKSFESTLGWLFSRKR